MTVAALAGRRVDAPDAQSVRFPSENTRLVRGRIQQELEHLDVHDLVCSAACGADLLALGVAGDLGIRRRAVLPADAAQFRRTSVEDRPGDWGPLFDRIIADLRNHDDVVTIEQPGDESQAYLRVNSRILDDAQRISDQAGAEMVALVVWDGRSRGDDDVTAAFAREARRRGLRVVEISTLREDRG